VKWRIYYGDGSVLEGEGCPDVEVVRNVQIIVQEHPDIGWHTQSGHDYYVWRDDRFVGVDLFGLYDWLMERGDVLFGRTISTDEYNATMKRALEHLGDQKQTWARDERRPD
jgi:hypothetical protein